LISLISELYFKFNPTFFLGILNSGELNVIHESLLQRSISASASGAGGGVELDEEALEEGVADAVTDGRITIDNPYSFGLKGEFTFCLQDLSGDRSD